MRTRGVALLAAAGHFGMF